MKISDYELGDASRRAAEIVSQERSSHGDAYENHKQIAELWTAFLGDKLVEPIHAWESGIMMQQVKQSRMQSGRLVPDHFIDVAGYADVGLESAIREPGVEVESDDG